MSTQEMIEDGVVAIHRWFANGEGWARHPAFPLEMMLSPDIKAELNNREGLRNTLRRSFCYSVQGKVLFGVHALDANCPDEKAVGRIPSVLRVVLLPFSPKESNKERIVEELDRLEAMTPGEDRNLKLKIDLEAMTPREDRNLKLKIDFPTYTLPPTKERQFKRHWLVAVIVLVLCVGGGLLWLFNQAPKQKSRPRANDNNFHIGNKGKDGDKKKIDKMAKMLQRWKNGKVDGKKDLDENKIAKEFFYFLSQEGKVPRNNYKHPDADFVRRLPEKSKYDSNKDLTQALKGLLSHLQNNAPPKPTEGTADLLEDLEKKLDYYQWWKLEGSRLKYDYDLNERDDKLAKFSICFAGFNENPWERDIAKEMVKNLKQWRVNAFDDENDAEKRPYLVIHCFFQFLSRQHFTDDQLKGHDYETEFVRRLPKMPHTTNSLFETEAQLIEELKKLAEDLHAKSNNSYPPTLIDNIGKALNYDNWKNETNLGKRDENNEQAIKAFVERFKSKWNPPR